MPISPPLDLPRWLKDNSDRLRPPVNNFCLYSGTDFVVMAVGGPNARADYHVNETEGILKRLVPGYLGPHLLIRTGMVSINTKVPCSCVSWMTAPSVTSRLRRARCFYSPVSALCARGAHSAITNKQYKFNSNFFFPLPLAGFTDIFVRASIMTGNTPHNPVRFADTVGIVIERVRPEGSTGTCHHHPRRCARI